MRALFILGVVAMTGCDNPLEANRQQELWKELDVHSYTFVYEVSCFCALGWPNPALISVVDGQVVDVEPTDDSTVPINGSPRTWPTIDSLFALVRRTRDTKPAVLDVEYDETYHFPRVIHVDPVLDASDDEVTHRVTQFTPSSSGN
jgi:hypothetical protein